MEEDRSHKMSETMSSPKSNSRVDDRRLNEGGFSRSEGRLLSPPANVVFSTVVKRSNINVGGKSPDQLPPAFTNKSCINFPRLQLPLTKKRFSPLGRYGEPPLDDRRQLCLAWIWRSDSWLYLAKKLSPPNFGGRQSSLLKLLPSFITNSDVNPRNNDDDPQSSLSANSEDPDNHLKDDVDCSSSEEEEEEPLIRRRQTTSLAASNNSEGDPVNYNVSTSSGDESTLAIITDSSSSPDPLPPSAPRRFDDIIQDAGTSSSINRMPLFSRARSSSALPVGGFTRALPPSQQGNEPPPPPPGGVEQEVDNRWKLTMDNMLGLMGILAGFAISSIFNLPGGSVNNPYQVAGVGTANLLPYGYGTEVIYGLSGGTIVIILFLLLCFLGGLGGPRFSRIALLLLAEAILSEVASLATHMLINLDHMHGHTPMWLAVVFLFAAIFVFFLILGP